MKKLLLISFFLASVSVFAQQIAVNGTITDENGNPLVGATVQVKGTPWEQFAAQMADIQSR